MILGLLSYFTIFQVLLKVFKVPNWRGLIVRSWQKGFTPCSNQTCIPFAGYVLVGEMHKNELWEYNVAPLCTEPL